VTIIGWILWLMLGGFLEGLALAGKGTPLTDALRAIRYDPIGKFVIIPLGFWLLWHVIFRPKKVAAFGWRDLVFIGAGVAYALCETFGWLGIKP